MDESGDPGLNQHASKDAHEFLLRETVVTLNTLRAVRDLGITEDMAARFPQLGAHMFGKQRFPPNYL